MRIVGIFTSKKHFFQKTLLGTQAMQYPPNRKVLRTWNSVSVQQPPLYLSVHLINVNVRSPYPNPTLPYPEYTLNPLRPAPAQCCPSHPRGPESADSLLNNSPFVQFRKSPVLFCNSSPFETAIRLVNGFAQPKTLRTHQANFVSFAQNCTQNFQILGRNVKVGLGTWTVRKIRTYQHSVELNV